MDPPPTANQKRKRGRPTNASRENGEVKDASTSTTIAVSRNNHDGLDGEIGDGGMEAGPRPMKRSRRTKNDVPQEPQPESPPVQPRRRGRRQPGAAQIENRPVERTGNSAPSSEETKTTKRGRPKKGDRHAKPHQPEPDEADDENEDENDENSSFLRRSRRHRHSLDGSPTVPGTSAVQGRTAGSSTTRPAAKSRKQPNKPVNKEQPEEEEAEAEASSAPQAQKRTRKRKIDTSKDPQPSVDEAEPEPESLQKRRGRPPKARGNHGSPDIEQQGGSSQRQTEPADEEARVESERGRLSATHRKSRGRRRSPEAQDQSPARSYSSDSDSASPPYRYIAKRTRRVTHEVIESKWSSLDPSSIANIANLLHSVSLPTLLHVVPKQYAHAEDVLEKVMRGLRKRSARLPFPPASTLPRREDELDFERTQSAVEVLLSQLDPLQHSVELLKRERERAEKELEREYKVLSRLSTNARAEARERRDHLRKVHVLVPETIQGLATDSLDLLPADKTAGQVFAGIQDAELLSLAGQVNSHMESMRGNIRQIEGILPAIAKSHALLKTTLQPQFSQKQLENIMLGQVEQ